MLYKILMSIVTVILMYVNSKNWFQESGYHICTVHFGGKPVLPRINEQYNLTAFTIVWESIINCETFNDDLSDKFSSVIYNSNMYKRKIVLTLKYTVV